ncbi:MAG TPA: hypothetical protein VHV27_05780 [Phenylobacterium sp.]|jgi:hypothetical protein|nr:hypothetical protein [Phenylobacterium sp.]
MASDIASEFAFPLQDQTAAAERSGRARSVSAELETIFGRVAPGAASRARPRVARSPHPGGTARRRISAASLGALGAAALAGLAAGTLLMRRPPPPAKPHPAALPVEMVAPAQTPQAADAALAAPVAAPGEAAVAQARPASPPPAARHVRPARSYAALKAADHRLRAAYSAAIRAGVPRARLAEDRDRWASVRRRDASDPVRMTATYASLARDLDRAAAEARRPARRAPRRSFFHPRFLPWWR